MFSIIQGGWNFRKEGGVDENDMRNNSRGCVRSVDGFPAALESLPVPNENKAYGELYGRIVERICLWPGLAPLCLMSEENMARSMKPVGLTDEECRDLLVWGWPLRILSSTITMNSFRIYT